MDIMMTLGMRLTAADFVRVVLPQANYNTSSIGCTSGGIALTCTVTTDPASSNLTISLPPPCSQCTAGSSLSFTLTNLVNPSFISPYTQSIVIQTAHPEGTVEQLVISSDITAASVSIRGYARDGPTTVGSGYSMGFNVSVPGYISKNGGQLVISFVEFDSYVPVVYNSGFASYSYPGELSVLDSITSAPYSNSLLYYGSANPKSILKLVIQICGTNPCSGNLKIGGLLRGYNPLSVMTQKIQLTTQSND